MADIDVNSRGVTPTDDTGDEYDYLVVALGSQNAFAGIDGFEEHVVTLKSLDDALQIHDEIETAASNALESETNLEWIRKGQ